MELKRKRHVKEETEEKKAEEATEPAAELAELAVEPPPPLEPTQGSQDIITAPEPQVHGFDSTWQRGCKWLQGGCKVVARRLHELGGCFQVVSQGGCIFWRLFSSSVIRRLHK